jgi:hypothetical protein
MFETIIKIIFCHLVGDYVLQNDFLAKTKGKNFYHLLVHCALYCLPFALVFNSVSHFTCRLVLLFAIHVWADWLKAGIEMINYPMDQIIHYFFAVILFAI